MSTLAEARRLAAEAQAIGNGAGIPTAGVTDATRAGDLLNAGEAVVVLNPPTVAYPTWTEVDATWQAWVLAGPATDTDTAWGVLDTLRDALAGPFEIDRAEPNTFTDAQGTAWPALVLTFTSHHDKE